MDDSKIDFSSLDPSRNPQHWEARISAIAQQAAARRRRQLTVMGQLLGWARPMLAVAAGVALVGWIALVAKGEPRASVQTKNQVEDPAMMLATWAVNDEVPNPEALMAALGGSLVEQ
jgi:hypothetical protein